MPGGLATCVLPAVSVGLALGLDVLVGEPPERVHPVALFGRVVAVLDRPWPAPRFAGFAIATLAPPGSAALAVVLLDGLSARTPIVGAILAGTLLFSTISLRRLVDAARAVIDATASDLDRARAAVPALAGRDPSDLSAGALRSAAVESLAENLADGFVAPLLAFVAGAQVSLSIGVGAAVWVKAVNTLDSMLGYREKPIGWASARLDDLVMWLPARLTAALIALAALDPGAAVRARQFAATPPSPNSGWPMATLGVILEVRLEKPGVYVLSPEFALPDVVAATRAISVIWSSGALAGLLTVLVVGVSAC